MASRADDDNGRDGGEGGGLYTTRVNKRRWLRGPGRRRFRIARAKGLKTRTRVGRDQEKPAKRGSGSGGGGGGGGGWWGCYTPIIKRRFFFGAGRRGRSSAATTFVHIHPNNTAAAAVVTQVVCYHRSPITTTAAVAYPNLRGTSRRRKDFCLIRRRRWR